MIFPPPLGPLLDVFEPLREKTNDVLVVEGIEDLLAGPAGTNQPHAAQQAELMRDGRLAQTQQFGDVADTQLAAVDRVQDTDPCGITKRLEGLGQRLNRGRIQ